MQRIELSKCCSLSPIVQGLWRLNEWGFSTEECKNFFEGRIERGVTTFDTAEIYGRGESERLFGDVLKKYKDVRSKIQIVTKTGIFAKQVNGKEFKYYDTQYDRVKQSCKESLLRLGTDYIDLYLIHREDPCIDPWETGRALLDLKKEGLIRAFGVSNFDPFKFNALYTATNQELVTNQIECSPVCFEHFDSGLIDLLTMYKIRPMIWSPVANGRLFTEMKDPYMAARKVIQEIAKRHKVTADAIVYAWLMYHPVGAIPIIGSKKLSRLDDALQAFDVKLEHSEWYEIFIASKQKILK